MPDEPKGNVPSTPPAAAPPPKPTGPVPVPWNSEIVARLKQRHGPGITETSTYLGQEYVIVERSIVRDVLLAMRDDEEFDYLVDVTAVHYPQREKHFDVVWILYSFSK